jgi:hypothetical protein
MTWQQLQRRQGWVQEEPRCWLCCLPVHGWSCSHASVHALEFNMSVCSAWLQEQVCFLL